MKLSLVNDQSELLAEWRVELEHEPPVDVDDIPFDTWYLSDFQDRRCFPHIGEEIAEEVLKDYKNGHR